jgi:hypothetical protein
MMQQPMMQQPVVQVQPMMQPAPLPGPTGRAPPMPPEAVVPGLGVNEPSLSGPVKMTDQGILVEVVRDFEPPAGFEEAQLLRALKGFQVIIVSENHEGSGWAYGHFVDANGTWSGFFPRACVPLLDIVVATHEFNREGLKEVSLQEGDRLFVEQRHGSGWYLGRHILPSGLVDMTQSKCGWFPASHCRDGAGAANPTGGGFP